MTKAARAHVVPLSPLALELLAEAKEMADQLFAKLENAKFRAYVFTTLRRSADQRIQQGQAAARQGERYRVPS